MQDFASAAMVRLLVRAMAAHGLVPPPPPPGADGLAASHVPLAYKRSVVEAVLHQGGLGTLLQLAQRVDLLACDPVHRALLGANDVPELMARWQRLERYVHSRHQVSITASAPGALALRRGATNALDWFAMMAFSFFVILAWVGWSALTLGWPQKLAQRTVILRPGFVGQIEPIAIATAVICTLWWFWMIFSTPRSPYRSLLHWAMGFTIFWALLTLLWLPWFDFGRSYRPVAQALARQLSREQGCLAEMNLGDTQRASIAYFSGLEAKRFRADKPCEWLVVQNRTPAEISRNPAWEKVWEGSRPGERKERFTLYRKQP